MRRREFIKLAGSAAASWPIMARAQQAAMPLIGFLSSRSPEDSRPHLAGFLRGLEAFGYADGKTAKIEYRWANGQYDQVPKLASELVNLHPAIIVAPGGAQSARAAKLATTSIPVFFVTSDSVEEGLVASLNRPGGNVTGVDIMSGELTGKRLELLAQLVPSSSAIAFLATQAVDKAASKRRTLSAQLAPSAARSSLSTRTTIQNLTTFSQSWRKPKLAVWSLKTIPSSTLAANISSDSQRSVRFRRFITFVNFRWPGD